MNRIKKVKPPISYLGGKIKMVDAINKIISDNFNNKICFVDLFGGSGSVLLNVTGRYKFKSYVYNDLDGEIVNMYRVISDKDKLDVVVNKFKTMIHSRELFEELRHADISQMSDVDRCFRTIYLWKYSASSRRSSEKSFTYGYSKSRSIISFDNVVKEIGVLWDIVRKWYVENLDYKEVIKKYDGENTLFFIDPPYYDDTKNTKYYKHNMSTKEDQYEIKNVIESIKGSAIITYPNSDFYVNLYGEYQKQIDDKAVSTKNWGNGIINDTALNELVIIKQ